MFAKLLDVEAPVRGDQAGVAHDVQLPCFGRWQDYPPLPSRDVFVQGCEGFQEAHDQAFFYHCLRPACAEAPVEGVDCSA